MKVLVDEVNLKNIAKSIRNKLKNNNKYKPCRMPEAIESIETGIHVLGNPTTRTAVEHIPKGNFVSEISKVESGELTRSQDISTQLIRIAKLTPTKCLMARLSKDLEINNKDNYMNAYVVTTNENNTVTRGDPISVPAAQGGNIRTFDLIALSENKVVMMSCSTNIRYTVLDIKDTTITVQKTGVLHNFEPRCISLAKVSNDKFVCVYGNVDRTEVSVCVVNNDNSVGYFKNTVADSGCTSYHGSISTVAMTEDKFIVVKSNPYPLSNGITVTQYTSSNKQKLKKNFESTISGNYGSSAVSATLLSNGKLFVAFGATTELPRIYGVVCTINNNITVGNVQSLHVGNYSSVSVTKIYADNVVVACGGCYVSVQNPVYTKVTQYNIDSTNITRQLEAVYNDVYGSTPILYLGGTKVFIGSIIKPVQGDGLKVYLGFRTIEFKLGVCQAIQGANNIIGISSTEGLEGEKVTVLVPREVCDD